MKTKLLLLLLVISSIANAQITNGLIHEFRFNFSRTNVAGTANFTASGTTFVADRTGSALSAIQITNATSDASLSGLPTGAAARTISYWYKTSVNAGFPLTFSYGINTPNRMFGMYLGPNGSPTFYCNTGDVGTAGTYAADTWRHIVITYDGSRVITYLDGIVIINSAIALNTGLSNLSLGHATNAVVTIDDLQIFNRALLPSEVQVLNGGAFPDAIAEYDFNNSYNNKLGAAPFTNVPANSFVTDRNGVPNSALFVNNNGVTATIPGIPYGTNLQVSVSIWVKFIGPLGTFIYSYGTWPNTNAPFVTSTTILATGPGGNHTVNTTNVANAWTHFVFVYDGTNSIIYKNGVSLSSLARNWNFINDNNLFKIGLRPDTGASQMNAEIDDLKIYNYALDQTRITNLFNNNTLTAADFNQNNLKISLYPNPANNILNIEMTNEIKSIEIYNIQGIKVLETNQKQINVFNLASGMYIIRIQDNDNGFATKKFMKL